MHDDQATEVLDRYRSQTERLRVLGELLDRLNLSPQVDPEEAHDTLEQHTLALEGVYGDIRRITMASLPHGQV